MINARQIVNLRTGAAGRVKFVNYPKIENYRVPLLLILLHVPLGLLLYRSTSLALIHPLAVLITGLYFAVRRDAELEKVAYVAAYIIGAEVLWRMAQAEIYWEFGKYAVALIMIVALVRRSRWNLPKWPLIFLVLLIPACLSTMFADGLSDAKDKLSFNMSGPFLLFVSCWFFSHVQITLLQLKKLLIYITIPLVSVAFVSLFYTVTIENIDFFNDSNYIVSGGFGPNQVSSMLGMGVFLILASYLLFKNGFKDTAILSLCALLFAAQSVLTFSRGGMYNAIGATLAVAIFQMRDLRKNIKRLVPLFGLGLVFLLMLFPYLDDFTGGALQTRFEDTGTTGRTEIVEADFRIFYENPILGAGVGEARDLREAYFGKAVAAHTEFARIMAEHGLLGIFALCCLFLGVVHRLQKSRTDVGKALTIGVVAWSSLFMLSAGMRLAAPAFLWGLSFVTMLVQASRRNIVGNRKVSTVTGPDLFF